MAFDAQWEDYQRLALRFAQSLDDADPLQASRAFAGFGRQYAQDRDSLPQTDADRAFHLVAEATNIIDYHLPFATDEEAETIISRGHRLLEEAITLNPLCHDAIRMDAASRCPSFESYYDFLVEHEPEVRARCLEARDQARLDTSQERAEMLAQLALWPYLRWQAMIASKALICGRNRQAIRICLDLLDLDPTDAADARFTASLAYAKLEDEQGLDQFELRCRRLRRPHTPPDAWLLLARLSLAYRRRDLPRARQLISRLIELYPHALTTLAQQRELPDGVFARLAVPPFSEDELVLAVSEATVLTQEGRDSLGHGTLGTWLLEECLSRATRAELDELRGLIDGIGQPGDAPAGGSR